MSNTLDTEKKLTKLIHRNIGSDGRVLHYSSEDELSFSTNNPRSTTFFAAMTGLALKESGCMPDKILAIKRFLESQASKNFTWGYWDSQTQKFKDNPYPHDMDDTALCAALILQTQPEKAGDILGHIVHVLAGLEEKEGGPYKTWIVPDTEQETWYDVDLVVNTHIAFMLDCADIQLEELTAYLEKCIKKKQLTSKYYPSTLHAAYALSRLSNNLSTSALVRLIDLARSYTPTSILEYALKYTLLARLNTLQKGDEDLIVYIKEHVDDISRHPGALCHDPTEEGKTMKAFSPTASAALCLEALHHYSKNKKTKKKASRKLPNIYTDVVDSVKDYYANSNMAQSGNSILSSLLDSPSHAEIVLFPYYFALSMDTNQSSIEPLLNVLCTANLFGWIAYTIYDDFLDDEGKPHMLPVANISLQQVCRIYEGISPSSEYISFFYNVMRSIDEANAWEIAHCRFNPSSPLESIQVPDYKDLKMLADRSRGHMLGPLTLLWMSDNQDNSHSFKNLEQSLEHYIIVRQLLDDAHDWEEDLQRGHINSAGAMLIKYLQQNSIQAPNTTQLRILFWESIVPQLTDIANQHIYKSKTALKKVNAIKKTDLFIHMLRSQEEILETMKRERKNALDFMNVMSS